MVKTLLIPILALFFMIILDSCIIAPDYPITPVIEYVGISKNSMKQSAINTDSIILTFTFTDGDGDLGQDARDTTRNVFIIDTRDGNIQDQFKSPYIPEEGIGNGISGDMQLTIYTTCCIFPDGIIPCTTDSPYLTDTLSYEVYIKDRAGNKSNIIITEPIILRCQGV